MPRVVLASVLLMSGGLAVACGGEDTAPSAGVAPTTWATGTGADPKTYVDDPCRFLTVGEVKATTGLDVVAAKNDAATLPPTVTRGRFDITSCSYVGADGLSLLSVLVSTIDKAEVGSLDEWIRPVDNEQNVERVEGVVEPVYTYTHPAVDAVIWGRDLPGPRYLSADLTISHDRDAKRVPPTTLVALAEGMLRKT